MVGCVVLVTLLALAVLAVLVKLVGMVRLAGMVGLVVAAGAAGSLPLHSLNCTPKPSSLLTLSCSRGSCYQSTFTVTS